MSVIPSGECYTFGEEHVSSHKGTPLHARLHEGETPGSSCPPACRTALHPPQTRPGTRPGAELTEGNPQTLPTPPTPPKSPSPPPPRGTHVLQVAEDEVLGRCVKGSARGRQFRARDKAPNPTTRPQGPGTRPQGPGRAPRAPDPSPLRSEPPPTHLPATPQPQEGYDGLHHHLLHLLALPAVPHGCRRLAAPAPPPPPEAAEGGRERAQGALGCWRTAGGGRVSMVAGLLEVGGALNRLQI